MSSLPHPPLFSGAPNAPTQWIHLHPDYRTNCHAGRKANQILRQQLGEEIAFPLSSRESGHRPCASGFTGKKEAKGEKGKVTRLQEMDCKSTAGQVTPLFSHLYPVSCHFPLPSPLILTLPISHQRHQGLHSSLLSSRWNGTIIMGIEWLWPPNWGRSDHNNTLSNLIK